MKLPFIVLTFWLAFFLLAMILVRWTRTIDAGVTFILVYVVATSLLERSGYQSLWLRNCALMRWLQARFAAPRPDVVSTPGRRKLRAIEPHGEACWGYTTTFVPSTDGRVRLLAWSFFRWIPLLRDLYLLSGIVPANAATARYWLAAGYDIAVIPSGLRGLYGAVVDPPGPQYNAAGRRIIRVYKVGVSFCALAIKERLVLEPWLSCGEDLAFKKYRLLNAMPFLSTIVALTFTPVFTIQGTPLDGAEFTDVDVLADAYYAQLTACAERAGYTLEVIDCTHERTENSKRN